MDKPLIDPQTLPMWTVSSFILAMLALVVAFYAVHQSNVIMVGTQAEVVALNQKIEDLRASKAPAVASAPIIVEEKKPQ